MKREKTSPALIVLLLVSLLLAPAASMAATVWVNWTSKTQSSNPNLPPVTPGSASGNMDAIDVSYTGELTSNTVIDGTFTFWDPDSSFTGGAVTNGPGAVGDIIGLNGSTPTQTNTITFSTAVTNPVIAV